MVRLISFAFWCLLVPALLRGAVPPPGAYSYTGTFFSDDDAREFFFTLSAPATVTLRTYSYAGGANAAGDIIPRGGFDPTVSLFDSGGATVAINRDGGCDRVAPDAVTSSCWDAALTASLPAGNYRVVLTQSDNVPSGAALADSFLFSGQGNFTQPPGSAASGFWDYYPDKRTGFYALDIQGVSSSQAPASVTSITAPRAITGLPYAPYALSVAGAPGSTFAWTAVSALPPGFSLSPAGVLQGTPTAKGLFTFSVQATDAVQTVQQTVAFAVYDPLSITTALLPAAPSGQAYGPLALAAIGGSGTYLWSASNLPPGLSLAGNGQLSGTPTTVGVFANIVVTVSDGTSAQSVTRIFSLTVTAPPTPPLSVIGPGNLPGIALGGAVSAIFTAAGGKPPYSWSASSLPSGVFINATTGVLSGVPGAPGIYSFFVQVADAQSATASLVVTLPVLGFLTQSLPGGTAGVPYLVVVTAVGGAPPFTFSATGLPAGLTLTAGGLLSGTVSSPANYPLIFTVRDAAGVSASLNLNLPIANAIVPGQADLVLSETTLSFSITTGASGLPDPGSVTVRSSAVEQLLNYSVGADVPWLDVAGGGTTPGSIGVALNRNAANLPASAVPYTASITVRCIAPATCAGSTQTIAVSLRVNAAPPQLALSDELLSFVSTPGTPAAPQTFAIRNTGGGTLQIQLVITADAWLGVSATPTNVASGTEQLLTVTADASGFAPGYRRGSITVVSSAGQATVYVGLLVASAPAMSLSPGAMQFELPAGGALGRVDGSFDIGIAGAGTVTWSAAPIGAAWLRVTAATGTASAASAGRVTFAIDRAAAAGLAVGTYQGTVRVASSGVVDSPLDFRVVLNVTPVSAPLAPDPSPGGLVFTSAGPGAVQQETQQKAVQLRVSAALPAAYQASASANAAAWLSVSPAVGTASAASPAQSLVSVNAAGLAPGVYRGGISYGFAGGPVRTVNVTLIVTTSTGCVPTQAVPAQVLLLNNFSLRARLPAPLSVSVVDNCGKPLDRAEVSIGFSNGDAPLDLTRVDSGSGTLSGAWTPTGVSPQVTATATATAPGLLPGSVRTTGAVTAYDGPLITTNGVLHIYNPSIGGPIAPGTILQIYGVDLAAGDTTVEIGGIRAPVYYANPGQVNVQAPFELTPGHEYQVVVNTGGALSSPAGVKVSDAVPGIAAYPDGLVIAQHLDYSLVSQASPAKLGETIVLYLAGLGVTDQAVPTGSASPSDPLARPLTAGSLTLNGLEIPTQFVGLTPGSVGLYQVNFNVPDGTPEGVATLVFTQTGWRSNTVKLPVGR